MPRISPRHWRGWQKRLGQGGDIDPEFLGQKRPVAAVGFGGDGVPGIDADAPQQKSGADTVRHAVEGAAFGFGKVFHGRSGDVVGRQIVRVPPVRRRRGRGEAAPGSVPPEPGGVAVGIDTRGGHDDRDRGHGVAVIRSCVKRPSHPPLVGQAILQPTTQRCVNAKILPLFPVNANHHPPILSSSHPLFLPSSLPPILPASYPPILPSSHPPILLSSYPPILPSSPKKERRPPVSGKAQLFRWLVCLRDAKRGKKKRKKKAKKKAASQRKGEAFSVAGVPSERGSNCYDAVRFRGRVEQVGF